MKYVYYTGHFLLAIGFCVLFLSICYELPQQQARSVEQAERSSLCLLTG